MCAENFASHDSESARDGTMALQRLEKLPGWHDVRTLSDNGPQALAECLGISIPTLNATLINTALKNLYRKYKVTFEEAAQFIGCVSGVVELNTKTQP